MSVDGDGRPGKPLTVQEITNEIQHLLELQRFALDRVKYLGMTQDEAAGVDKRRKEISGLVNQLASHEAAISLGSRVCR